MSLYATISNHISFRYIKLLLDDIYITSLHVKLCWNILTPWCWTWCNHEYCVFQEKKAHVVRNIIDSEKSYLDALDRIVNVRNLATFLWTRIKNSIPRLFVAWFTVIIRLIKIVDFWLNKNVVLPNIIFQLFKKPIKWNTHLHPLYSLWKFILNSFLVFIKCCTVKHAYNELWGNRNFPSL